MKRPTLSDLWACLLTLALSCAVGCAFAYWA